VEQTASEFLRGLRGQRSQLQVARRLGYRGNPITDWERGTRYPTADEALRFATLSGIDVAAAFARFAPAVPWSPGSHAIANWLEALRGKTPLTELAQRVGASRFSIARWLSGAAKPRLPDFFRVVDALTGRLPEWAAELVPVASVPSLAARFQAAAAAKRLAFELPWTEALLRVLETEGYRSQRGRGVAYVAACLGIPTTQVEACLDQLLLADVIEKRGRGYRVKGQSAVDTKGGQAALLALKHHWSEVAAARALAPADGDFLAYNVISVSNDDLSRIRDLLGRTFREIRTLVAASRPEQIAAVVNLQIVTFAQARSEPSRAPTSPASPAQSGGTERRHGAALAKRRGP
jgi:transcriptional regulator with XRE-family HTH domain